MSDSAITVLDRRRGCVAVDKPAGLPTEPEDAFESSVLDELAVTLDVARSTLHAATRLDVGVSGIVLVALNAQARKWMAPESGARLWKRGYFAIAAPAPAKSEGQWNAPIGTGRKRQRAVSGAKAQPASTRYRVVEKTRNSSAAFVVLRPLTGRTHQLRVHAASSGSPLIGDRRYGGLARLTAPDGGVTALDRIALHASWTEIRDGETVWRVEAPFPQKLYTWWRLLEGSESALPHAIAESRR